MDKVHIILIAFYNIKLSALVRWCRFLQLSVCLGVKVCFTLDCVTNNLFSSLFFFKGVEGVVDGGLFSPVFFLACCSFFSSKTPYKLKKIDIN